MPRAPRRRKPGRPAGHEGRADPRESLLDAAARLYAGRGPHSLRAVATAAGVTPAMVHYYFGDRHGLDDALLERALAHVLERVSQVRRLEDLPATVAQAFGAEPWIPPLLVREVLSEGGRFRRRFIERYASNIARLVPGMLEAEIAAGRLRRDLDPKLAFVSLLGMLAFAFIARPVLEPVLGLRYDAAFLTRFAEHTRRLFLEGARS
ncbi:MAG TPA: TetR/AcrR family transcriptional regulator [Myxococcota bacterium]|nr:TetR/AcrR family transcriptional regulator [Myxococcota bacterium]